MLSYMPAPYANPYNPVRICAHLVYLEEGGSDIARISAGDKRSPSGVSGCQVVRVDSAQRDADWPHRKRSPPWPVRSPLYLYNRGSRSTLHWRLTLSIKPQ